MHVRGFSRCDERKRLPFSHFRFAGGGRPCRGRSHETNSRPARPSHRQRRSSSTSPRPSTRRRRGTPIARRDGIGGRAACRSTPPRLRQLGRAMPRPRWVRVPDVARHGDGRCSLDGALPRAASRASVARGCRATVPLARPAGGRGAQRPTPRAPPSPHPLMRLREARVLLVQRANMRDGLDDAQRGREQASRRAARISADLATAELQASAELRMFERRAE